MLEGEFGLLRPACDCYRPGRNDRWTRWLERTGLLVVAGERAAPLGEGRGIEYNGMPAGEPGTLDEVGIITADEGG